MASTVLPNDRVTFLPATPTDGQVFVDSEFVQWIYNAANKIWERRGVVSSIPLADSLTTGYISATDKDLLDGVAKVPGGFGIIVDTKLLAKTDTNPDGIIQGDIKLKSDSLDIVCVGSNGTKLTTGTAKCPPIVLEGQDTTVPALQFSIKPVFLDTFIAKIPGPKGQRGDKGLKGPKGSIGFGATGPEGDPGVRGEDVEASCTLEGVGFSDEEGLTDTAIVDIKVDNSSGHGCKLIVTKAKLNISSDRPADKVEAVGLSRTLFYAPDPDASACDVTRLDDWTLVQPVNDQTPLNLQVLRISKGSNDRDEAAVGFNATMSLNDLITGIVDEYKTRLTTLDTQWGKEAKAYIEDVDAKARGILSKLADDLARCEFNLPAVEFGITISEC